jgi:hypothetical protein
VPNNLSLGIKKVQACRSISGDLHHDSLFALGIHQGHDGRVTLRRPHKTKPPFSVPSSS